MANDVTTPNGFLEANDSEYVRLVSLISDVWEKAKYDTGDIIRHTDGQ